MINLEFLKDHLKENGLEGTRLDTERPVILCEKKMKVAQLCLTLRLYSLWNSPGQNTGAGSRFLLQGGLPDPGAEAASPALAGGLCTTAPTGTYIRR